MSNKQYDNVRTTTYIFCIKKKKIWSDQPDREIIVNKIDTSIGDNSIQTNKYTWIDVIPMNIYEQFSRLANVYFLVIGLLSMIKAISNTGGRPVVLFPLSIIMGVNILKNIYEDLKRRSSDKKENNSKTQVLTHDGFISCAWSKLYVGNIVKIEKDQQIPADLMILYSHEEKGNCFIETKNLDGETNLKEKRVSSKLLDIYKDTNYSNLYKKQISYKFERPNPYLYNFSGTLQLDNNDNISIDNNGFVLRGCVLRNTSYIYGVVTYNGHESKIMLNSVNAKPKMSLLEKMMNRQIIYIAIIQISLCFGFAIVSVIYQQIYKNTMKYMEFDKDNTLIDGSSWWIEWPIYLGKWVLILNGFIPISLIVSHEMVKYFQAGVISKDDDMKSTFYGDISAEVQSSSLTEELGQLDYIFSDKTGTLTCNIMDFKKLFSFGKVYGDEYDIKEGRNYKTISNVSVRDKKLFDILDNYDHEEYKNISRTLLFLSLCHTALIEGEGDEMKYCVHILLYRLVHLMN